MYKMASFPINAISITKITFARLSFISGNNSTCSSYLINSMCKITALSILTTTIFPVPT
jgi:hypothetical protein